MSNENILTTISEKLQAGQASELQNQVQQALDQGVEAEDILNNGLMHGMSIIGEKFKNNDVYVPEVLIAARAMNSATEILQSALDEAGVEPKGTVCLATVKGDLHDIGKNLVSMMLEGAGYSVVDLGVNVETEAMIKAVQENNASILGLSALLTTTMPLMGEIVTNLEEADIRDDVKVIIGGAPVTQNYADKIGADGYASDAATAVTITNQLLG